VNGARKDSTTSKVDACGTKDGKDVAWILVNQTGEVTFFNQNGDKSGCQLNNDFKTGSWCNTTDPNPVSSKDAVQSSVSSLVSLPTLDSSSIAAPDAPSTATPEASSTAAPELSSTITSGSVIGSCS
jgi:formate-dependent nitrite reductase cytochrome c552 subunit